ncbi:hypothetical protein BLNAU_14783 [Blattamonas nauphoetae]|uniref:Protein kinase domain-containing protein n=1 Tax=Blattamonas nauphoetae TaxID=2049346 RepID=A0ABQ9XJ50_9EUKA|nr:hypothetical protein BLNAU_14783 [Blattamonas nauphoetae]
MFMLNEDVFVSSMMQIRSEEITLIGNSARLQFHEALQQNSNHPSWSRKQPSPQAVAEESRTVGNNGLSAAIFMFEVTNSTFSMSGVHTILNTDQNGICSIAGSIVRFSASSIISNGFSSPFLVKTTENDGNTMKSSIILSDVMYRSRTDYIAPLVDLTNERTDDMTAQAESITIVGTDLSLESKDLVGGTGPLFSFGVSEHHSVLVSSKCVLHIETSLLQANLKNVTSSSGFSQIKQSFGSEIAQRVVGCSVSCSSNHDSGTGMMSPNLGGNVMCLNTSFSSCIRERNKVEDFQNKNYTQGSRLETVPSDVTSVTFTLCTFNEITAATSEDGGGSAICLMFTSSSLTIRTCFFHKCTCTGSGDDGGAIFFMCSSNLRRPISLLNSSFTECSSLYDGSSFNCGGSLGIRYTKSATMDRCFFERSKGDYDGAVNVLSELVTFSNISFVECSSTNRAGAFMIDAVETLSLSFLQFRGCASKNDQNGKDIYFYENYSSQIKPSMLTSCDSTSGSPNVYFKSGNKPDSTLVPQIDEADTTEVKSVHVAIDGDEATVRVVTTNSINGTMNVLLDGLNVPRLIHVVFGDDTISSNLGTAVVSSGENGVLPHADYVFRSAAVTGYRLESSIGPFIFEASSTLDGWNTAEIVVNGANLEEGSYSMLIVKGGDEWNIPLTLSNSTTLKGTAPLDSTPGDGTLEWATEYEVRRVVWKPEGELTEEEVTVSDTLSFTTPDEPARIEGAGCSLNGLKDVAVVELTGTKLTSDGQTLAVVSRTSNEMVSSGELFNVTSTKCFVNFSIGESESSTHVVFGGHYDLLSVGSESSSILVVSGLFFEVPHPPTITSIATPDKVSTSTFDLSVSGSNLPSTKTFTVTLTSGHTFELLFSSATSGTSDEIAIGGSGQLQYNTEYTIKSIIRKEDGKDDEYILFTSTTFRTPLGPTLSLISSPFHSSDPNFLNVSLTTARMPSEDFTLTLKTTQLPSETVSLTITPTDVSAGFILVEVYKQIDTLKYGKEYAVTEMKSSSVVGVVTALPFSTPAEPIRITSADCSLGGVQQKSALVTLTGVKLGGGKDFNVTVRKMEGSTPTVDGAVSIVNANVNFTVPDEPARLTSLEALLQYSSDEKNATISLSGIGMKGDYNLTLSVNSSASNNVTLDATFDAAGRGTVTAVLFDLSDPPVVDLSYNARYEVVDVTQESDSIFFEDELVFTTIAVPPRLLSIKMSEYSVGMDFVELSFGSVALPSDATFTLTLESVHSDATTPHQKVIILETDESGQLSPHEAQLYPFETEAEKKKGQLEYDTKYKVLSLSKGSTPIHFEDIPTRIQTPMEPPRIEKCTARTLNSSRTELTVSLEGRKLWANLGFLSLSAESGCWTSIGEIETDDETHCSVRFLTAGEEDPTHIEFGKDYTLKTVSVDESNFIVNDGIIVRVPFPPKVTKMEFSSSNSLSTGCYVKLTGTDLIVGYSLKITLNDSLFVIATIISETEARSSELPIGWPTTLKHNTEYTLTSMEAMNEGDGKTIFDSPIANTTGSPLDPFVIYVDSGSTSDSTLFCGDKVRPCSSIEDGWKIAEGIQIWSFSVSIVHNTTQKEQVKIQSHHDILIESGPSTKPELFVSPSSSSSSELEGEGMIEVVGGRLWLRDVDVVLTNSPSLIFIRMVGGHLTVETCSLTSTSSVLSNSADVLCSWSGGAIVLEHATTTITSSTFSEMSHGAIKMKGGSLTIYTSSFDSNTPSDSSSFPSLRHNIHCSGEGQLKIGSLSAGDGMETPSAWISASDCSLTAKEEISNSPFFIPTLSSSSTSHLNKTEHAFSLTMEGSTLIPCSLFLEVFEKKKDGSEGQAKQFPLTQESASHFNDTTIVMSLPVSSLSGLDKGLEWRGRLVYGLKKTTASFVIQKNSVDRAAQAMRENMKWWIPVLVSLVCLLLLIVLVVLICWRRRQQKKGDDTQELTAHEELAPMDAEKMDIVDNDPSLGAVRNNSAEGNEVHVISEVGTNTKTFLNSGTAPNAHLCVEAIHCEDPFDTRTVRKVDTLYNILHRQDTRVEFSNRRLQRDLVEALKQLSAKEPMSELLTKLNPHNVIVSKEGRVSLKVKEDEAKTDGQILTEQSGFRPGVSGRTGNEQAGMRWEAPEVAKARETNAEGGKGESRKEVNRIQASIFSLGLVLWEIETGCVPFGEMDAVNAARQLETGVHPNMLWVMNATLRETLISCLSLNPSDRPSYDQILSVLDGLTGPPKINLEARQQPASTQNDPFIA